MPVLRARCCVAVRHGRATAARVKTTLLRTLADAGWKSITNIRQHLTILCSRAVKQEDMLRSARWLQLVERGKARSETPCATCGKAWLPMRGALGDYN